MITTESISKTKEGKLYSSLAAIVSDKERYIEKVEEFLQFEFLLYDSFFLRTYGGERLRSLWEHCEQHPNFTKGVLERELLLTNGFPMYLGFDLSKKMSHHFCGFPESGSNGLGFKQFVFNQKTENFELLDSVPDKKVSGNGTVFFEENLVLDLNKNKFQFIVQKEQKMWFHNNFLLFESPFGNEPPLDYDTFLELLGEENYLPLKVTVLGLYSGIISEEEVKAHLKTELTTSLRWLFLLANQELNPYSLIYSFPISLRDCSLLKILAEFKNTMAGNFYPKDSFERIQEVFHLTEDEVYSVLDESDFIRFHFVS